MANPMMRAVGVVPGDREVTIEALRSLASGSKIETSITGNTMMYDKVKD